MATSISVQRLSGSRSSGKARHGILVLTGLMLVLLGGVGCSGSEPEVDEDGSGVRTLRSLGAQRGILVGTAAEASHLTIRPFVDVMVREFGSVTPGNTMKMGPLRPTLDSYDFSEADEFVDFAEGQDLAVRGHVLVWHQQQPSWLTGGNWSREAMMSILHDHITTVVGRYRGRLYAWDVVNEAVADDGSLRETIWLDTIGPEYIDLAFQWAHEADPDALLFYNDYNAEGSGAKSDAVYQLVRRLQDDGIPVDGVGFQMHVTTDFSPSVADVSANLARLAALGLEVHITEMDVRMPLPEDGAKLARQVSMYAGTLEACLGAPNCTAFILWGLTDRYSWIPSTFPGYGSALIFDENYEPKLAYHALIDVLEN